MRVARKLRRTSGASPAFNSAMPGRRSGARPTLAATRPKGRRRRATCFHPAPHEASPARCERWHRTRSRETRAATWRLWAAHPPTRQLNSSVRVPSEKTSRNRHAWSSSTPPMAATTFSNSRLASAGVASPASNAIIVIPSGATLGRSTSTSSTPVRTANCRMRHDQQVLLDRHNEGHRRGVIPFRVPGNGRTVICAGAILDVPRGSGLHAGHEGGGDLGDTRHADRTLVAGDSRPADPRPVCPRDAPPCAAARLGTGRAARPHVGERRRAVPGRPGPAGRRAWLGRAGGHRSRHHRRCAAGTRNCGGHQCAGRGHRRNGGHDPAAGSRGGAVSGAVRSRSFARWSRRWRPSSRRAGWPSWRTRFLGVPTSISAKRLLRALTHVQFDGIETENQYFRERTRAEARRFQESHAERVGAALGATDAHFGDLGRALTLFPPATRRPSFAPRSANAPRCPRAADCSTRARRWPTTRATSFEV